MSKSCCSLCERPRVGALLEVRTVAAVLRRDRRLGLGVDADGARQVEQAQRRLEIDGVDRHRLEERRRARLGRRLLLRAALLRRGLGLGAGDDLAGLLVDLFRRGRVDLLHVGSEAAVLDDDELAVGGVLAEHAVAGDRRVDELLRLGRRELVGGEVLGDVHAARLGLGVLAGRAISRYGPYLPNRSVATSPIGVELSARASISPRLSTMLRRPTWSSEPK